MRVDFDTSGVRAIVIRRPRRVWLQSWFSGFCGFSLTTEVYLTIPLMLEFESEFVTLMRSLWSMNKATFNPYMRREIGKAVTRGVPRFEFQRPAGTASAAADLQRKGYHVLGSCFDAAALGEIRSRLGGYRLYDSQALNYQTELVSKTHFHLKERPDNVFIANYEFDGVVRCTPLLRLACDPRIIAAVESYIGCTPTIAAFAAWHTFPGQVDAPAEMFHRDRDCFSFVKLFVYLSDVDAQAGPHEFIQFSHDADALQAYFKSSGLQVDLPKLFEGNSRNLAMADLKAILGRNIVTTTGPAGFGFLEDTFGLHRGTRPQGASRLIFSVTYTGLPLRYANDNDRSYELSRRVSFAEAGLGSPSALERYLLRYLLR